MQVGKDFYASLIAEDELGVVVRAHINIEASVIDFLERCIPLPKLMPRLNYEARLRLACAFGLDQNHFHSLKMLGDIRNQFGHNLAARITEAKINELFSKLPAVSQSNVLESYNKTRADHPGMSEFHLLSAKDRFVFIAVCLKMFVFNAANIAHVQRFDT